MENAADTQRRIAIGRDRGVGKAEVLTDVTGGLRGAQFARSLRGTLVHLDDAEFELLFEACRLHTDGLTTGDVTLQACWDADRLDLGRVGIRPEPGRLCSDAAREILPWVHLRAVRGYRPEILAAWVDGLTRAPGL